MREPLPSRYEQLSDVQIKLINEPIPQVHIANKLNSYLGPKENLEVFKKSLKKLELVIHKWEHRDIFLNAYVKWANRPEIQSPRVLDTGVRQFIRGFARYIDEKFDPNFSLQSIDKDCITDFLKWLNLQDFAVNSKRRMFYMARNLVSLIDLGNLPNQINPKLVFPENQFPNAHKVSKPTEILDKVVWDEIIAASRAEAQRTIAIVQVGRCILNDLQASSIQNKFQLPQGLLTDFESYLKTIKSEFGLRPPAILGSFRNTHPQLYRKLLGNDLYSNILKVFYPCPRDIVPFYLLMSIYSLTNTSPLRALKWRHVSEKSVMGVNRISLTFEKPRAHTQYVRSFAMDDNDQLSPRKLLDFLQEWTSEIRRDAGIYKDNVFIFRTRESEIRGLLTTIQSDTDTDLSWHSAFNTFKRQNGLPHFTQKNIRITGLDIVRDQSNDDIRAVQAASGQSSRGVVAQHYEGPSIRKRREEQLSLMMQVQERFYSTKGKIDHRSTANHTDIGAATPGWACLDPYDSPIKGQLKGRLCQAFGFCPICPSACLDINSAYSLARLLQLSEEVNSARDYLDENRWLHAYQPILEILKSKWIPLFNQKKVIAECSKLNLGPLGKLE